MLATLDISKAVDEHGNAIEPVVEFDNPIFRRVVGSSFLSCSLILIRNDSPLIRFRMPNQFKCNIRPRSPKALSLIKQSKIPVV